MTNLYASPTGTGNGLSVDSPAAIAAVKSIARGYTAQGDVVVYLRGGTYPLASRLEFTSADSGVGSYKVIWKNYPGETPVLSGGVQISGWSLHDAQKNIWKASVPSGSIFRQIYVGGVKAERSGIDVYSSVYYYSGASYRSDDAAMPTFARPQDLEISVRFMPWSQQRECVSSVTRSGSTTTFNLGSGFSTFSSVGWGQGQWPYYADRLENAYEFLSASTQRQWYLDTSANMLYYVPGSGEDMATVDVRIPVLENVIYSPLSDPVSNVDFEGIDVAHTNWTVPTTTRSFLPPQANMYLLTSNMTWFTGALAPEAAVNLFCVNNVNFYQCNFRNLGGQGLHYGKGSKNCVADFNTFTTISSSAVYVGETTNLNPVFADQVSNIRVSNNLVADIGIEYKGAPGIFVGVVDTCKILHNEITGCPYTGISLGWGWVPSGYAYGNEIAYNKIHTVMPYPLHDGAGIYTLGAQGSSSRSSIHDNYIYAVGSQPNFIADCLIYLDEGSRYIDVYNNVTVISGAGTPEKWFYTNGTAAYNTASNNYQYGGMIMFANAGASLAGCSDAIALASSDLNQWPASAQNIALSSGPTGTFTTTTTTPGPTTTTTTSTTTTSTTTTSGPTTTTTTTPAPIVYTYTDIVLKGVNNQSVTLKQFGGPA